MHVSALEVLHQLEGEDDENPEVWYLSGWAWWLLGEARGAQESVAEDEESQGECWSEAKLCLQNYLTVRSPAAPFFLPVCSRLTVRLGRSWKNVTRARRTRSRWRMSRS